MTSPRSVAPNAILKPHIAEGAEPLTMADLHRLLDEVVEPQRQDEEDDIQDDDWDGEREQLDLPPALLDAQRRKLTDTPEATEERLELGDVVGVSSNVECNEAYLKLQALWTQELLSPEILPYDEDTVQTMVDALQEREEKIEQLQTQGTSENMHLDALIGTILRIDADRAKFLLCGLLKKRLEKIQEFPLHMRENLDRLSDNEKSFLKEYGTLLEGHLRKAVLDQFPQEVFQKLDEPDMIDEPDLETHVFIKCKEDVLIDNATDNTPPDLHEKGSVLIVRYSRIRDLILEDKVELLM